MLKLTRQLFSWTADPRTADYYERALFNGILGTLNPADGMTMYYVPLASGWWKQFGRPLEAFWCCTGTGIESFSKLGDSIYFHDSGSLYVNLYIASELDWREKNVRVTQETGFPEQAGTSLTFRAANPVEFTLRLRIPYWATSGGSVKLNGKPLEAFAAPGSYLTISQPWKNEDKVEVSLPMSLHTCPMPDDDSLQAIMYGPLVLVGRRGNEGLTKEMTYAPPTKPRDIPRHEGKPVTAPGFVAASLGPESWITVRAAAVLPDRKSVSGCHSDTVL